MTESRENSEIPDLRLDDLHDELMLSIGLYRDGYYDEAVRKASQRFINRIAERAGRPDLDGAALIQKSFSDEKPLLEFNDRKTIQERNEHDGFRFLAVGLARGVRNLITHADEYGLTSVTALEWMAFISALHRRLDEARQVTSESAKSSR
ncbi:MAG: TIGR02391 family protein [bacterium]|nr:TIGR02391 family protein [bacterium]